MFKRTPQATSIMPITVSRGATRATSVPRRDRLFYGGVAIALALTVVAGFGPTYYFRMAGDSPLRTLSGGPVTLLVHTHAVLFTAWVLLFIVQTALIARHRTTMHRNVGMFGTGLAFLMVAAGALTAINQLNTNW
jgi:hypothetical protein